MRRTASVSSSRFVVVAALVGTAAVASSSSCSCQRPENIAAKARLTQPAPPDKHVAAAGETIDVDGLTDADKMRRVSHMQGAEVAARLGSFRFTSSGELSFGRGEAGVRSSEAATMLQADNGDFSIEMTTGDDSEKRMAFVNDILFLKNNNGKWRVSRDPTGERDRYRSDAMEVWGSFYDLVSHGLVVQRTGATSFEGRNAVGYALKLPDDSAAAKEEGKANAAELAAAPAPAPSHADAGTPAPDGGTVVVDDAPARQQRLSSRMSKWRNRAHAAGGSGTLLVDEKTGVLLSVQFEGEMLVGDGAEPARLHVKIAQAIHDVGRAQQVAAPADAIEDVLRKKMPVEPRAILEEEGVVPKLPRDAGPGAGGAGSKPAGHTGDLPDDEDNP